MVKYIYILSVSFPPPRIFCANYVRLKLETAKWSWHVRMGQKLSWSGAASCTITVFSLAAFKSSCGDVSFFPPVHMYIIQSLFCTSNMCSRLQCLPGFVWSESSPDKQPRSYMTLTKLVICAAFFRAERGHTLAADHTGKQTNAAGGICGEGGGR